MPLCSQYGRSYFPQDLSKAILSLPGSGTPWRELTSSRPCSLEGYRCNAVLPGNGEGPEGFIHHFLLGVESHEISRWLIGKAQRVWRPVVLNHSCTLELPGEFKKNPDAQAALKTIKLESRGMGPGSERWMNRELTICDKESGNNGVVWKRSGVGGKSAAFS